MKKIALVAIIAAGLGFFAGSCAKNYKEGFIDDDTFRVTGYGSASSKETDNRHMLRKFACEAALRDAQMKTGFALAEYGLKSVEGSVDENVYQDWVIKHFSGTIKGGSVIEQTFYENRRECIVVYEIKEKGLREKVRK